jgi:MFS family permease
MTGLLSLAAGVAVISAVRGLWSPCGLSVLSAINPVSERARGHRYGLTAAWYVAGAAAGGLVLGAGCALAALGYRSLHPNPTLTWTLAAVGSLLAFGADRGVRALRLPTNPRQVDVRWLTSYRRWVYAAGFGLQIGSGFATYIMTSATYLTVLLAGLSGRPLAAAGIGLGFGATRGLTMLVGARAKTPEQLRAVVERVDNLAGRSRTAVQLVVAGSACVASWNAAGLPSVGAALALLGAVQFLPERSLGRASLAATLPPTGGVQ